VDSAEIRTRLKRQQPTVGTWLQIPNPDVAEIIGGAGYDWAAVDMEHGAFTRSDLSNLFRSLECRGVLPFARLLEATQAQIKAALDSGARGLIFPMIASRAQLDSAVAQALYPGGLEFDGGRRGVGFSRANGYGEELEAHLEKTRGKARDIVLIAQIEHVDALAELDAIFSHPRLDAYMIGPYDLSASMGLTGNFTHPAFLEALETIALKAQEHTVPKGFHVVQPDPDTLAAKILAGYSFLAYGIDAVFLALAAKNPRLPA
jgi:2-dehydro-3-deoxyglucarate aldolase